MRGGNRPALFRDAFNFGLRGRFVDLSARGDDELKSVLGGYFIDYKEDQNVTIDANTAEDWADARWVGFSQDEPNFLQPDGNPVFGVPESPADFSGFFAMKADDENLYFAVRVRDEGAPMIATDDTPNRAFFYDHLSVYLGLFDIGENGTSPHVEAVGEESENADNWQFLDPDTGAPFVATPGRTYRISPESDNSGTTLGPDYQIYTRALPYGGDGEVVTGSEVQTYNGGAVDSTIVGTTASTRFLLDADDAEVGYVMEWQVPLASLAGDITSRVSRTSLNGIEYPRFVPAIGDVIAFDYDVTDQDDDNLNTEVFMRGGNRPALFRDAFNFGLRGLFVEDGTFVDANAVMVDDEDGPTARATEIGSAQPNPFSDVTRIMFSVDEPTDVTLEVFNLLGQRVAVLVDGPVRAGDHLATFDARALPAGVYVSRLTSPSGVQVRKMVLAR